MSRFCSLFSGSKGNCTYIASAEGGILIDAGVSAKSIFAALDERGIERSSIAAIFVTHEHGDHIRGLRPLVKKLQIPVFASKETALALSSMCDTEITTIEGEVEVSGIRVSRFRTSHDCEGSSGYVAVLPCERKVAVCTDLGFVSDEVREALKGSDLVMIESNHEVTMLENGPYPYPLKRRILGEKGHLSNSSCAAELAGLISFGTTRLVLAHLSLENNLPELARASARAALMDRGMKEGLDYTLDVASPFGNKMLML